MKILLVKLGALGDVLRTTPLLKALKDRYKGCEIEWVVEEGHANVLMANAWIDRLTLYNPKIPSELASRDFDLAINLDKEPEALECIMRSKAKKKMGFGKDAQGALCPLNPESQYAYRLGLDDELKFKLNQKTYQEISFEQLGLTFKKEEYQLTLTAEHEALAEAYLKRQGLGLEYSDQLLVGLNTGGGRRFAGKILHEDLVVVLANQLIEKKRATILLLGGKDELERNHRIAARCPKGVLQSGAHSIHVFAAILKRCHGVVSSDSTAMHLAIATKTPVVAYFASTCASEIELYGRGKKVLSKIDCSPCYKKICPIDDQCMKTFDMEAIYRALDELVGTVSISS